MIKHQIDLILKKFPDINILDENGLIKLKLFEKVVIEVDFRKFPKPPKLKIPIEIESIFGKPNKFLDTLINWNKNETKNVVDIIDELNKLLILYKEGDVLILKDLFFGLLQWAKDMHPKAVHAFLERNRKGIISEFLLSDRGISHVMDFYQGLRPSPRLDCSFHSHPDGNINPTIEELSFFVKYKVNIISANPYAKETTKCYNSYGKEIEFILV